MPQRLEDLLFAMEEQFWLERAAYYQRNLPTPRSWSSPTRQACR